MQIHFDRQQAEVTVLADQYDREALLKALEKEGFEGSKVVKDGKS